MSESGAPSFPIVPRRRYGTWILAAGAGFVGTALIWSVATSAQIDWIAVFFYLFHPLILRGLGMTLQLTATVVVCALVVGTIIALMRLSASRTLQIVAKIYVWLFRGVPALIQLIFWFNIAFVIPRFSLTVPGLGPIYSVETNDIITPFAAAVVALSLCQAAYMAEIIRAGIRSVPFGQIEAARSLGISPLRLLTRIVVPQSMRFIIPPAGNEAISLLKTTSLVTYIAVDDLFYAAQSIYSRTFETIPLLIVVAAWYLAVVTLLSVGQGYLERHFGKMDAAISPRAARRVRRVALAAQHGSGK